jgi:hypothetical protein
MHLGVPAARLQGFNRRDMTALKAVLAPDVNWSSEPPGEAPSAALDVLLEMLSCLL